MILPQRLRLIPKKFAAYHLGYTPKEQQGTGKTEDLEEKKQTPQVLTPPTRRMSRRCCPIKDEGKLNLTDTVTSKKTPSVRSKAENDERKSVAKLSAASVRRIRKGNVRAVVAKDEEQIDKFESSHALKKRGRVVKKEVTNSSPVTKKTRTSDIERERSGSHGPSTSTRRRSSRKTISKKMMPNCKVDVDVWEKMNPPSTPINPMQIVARAAYRPKVDMSALIDELDSSDEEYVSEYQQPQSPTEDNEMDEDYEELDLEELINRASRRMGSRKS